MNSLPIVATIALACSSIATAFAGVCFVMFLKARAQAADVAALAVQMENDLAQMREKMETVSHRSSDQARRVAWLETRLRNINTTEPAPADEVLPAPSPSKPNITERRHRVLTLLRRGQTAETIANTLGMPHGEVELMINLTNAA